MKLNLKQKELCFYNNHNKYIINMRLCFFQNPIPENIQDVINTYYEDILKITTKQNSRTIICFRNVTNTQLACKINGNIYKVISTIKDFDFHGFKQTAEYIANVSEDKIEVAMQNAFEIYGIDKKDDNLITFQGETIDLKHPENSIDLTASIVDIITKCRIIEGNYNLSQKPALLDAIQTNAIKELILNYDVTYLYNITTYGDFLAVKYEDEVIISIPLAQIAFYGINIVNILNNQLDKLETQYNFNPIPKECGIAHLYFPETFTGQEPLSVKQYAAFGDDDGLLNFIEKQLNQMPKYSEKQKFLKTVSFELQELGIDLKNEIDELCSALQKTAIIQNSKKKTLDEMLQNKTRGEDDLILDYRIN